MSSFGFAVVALGFLSFPAVFSLSPSAATRGAKCSSPMSKIESMYPRSSFPPGLGSYFDTFLGTDDGKAAASSTLESARRKGVYDAYSVMPAITAFTREIFTPTMTYYSPATGVLSLPEYKKLTTAVDTGVDEWRRWQKGCYIEGGGWIGREVRRKGKKVSDISLGGRMVEGGDAFVRGEWELDLVLFDDQSMVQGVVEGVVLDSPLEGDELYGGEISSEKKLEIEAIEKRIESMYEKLENLKGQESSMGFMKQKQDIDEMEMKLRIAHDESFDKQSNTNGLGGVAGLVWACYGERWETDKIRDAIARLDSVDGSLEGFEIRGGISAPTVCEDLVAKIESGEWKGF